jgi:hypothetical protein
VVQELHVYITGETNEAVEAAVEMIRPLLTPVSDDATNEHKRKQVGPLTPTNPLIFNRIN